MWEANMGCGMNRRGVRWTGGGTSLALVSESAGIVKLHRKAATEHGSSCQDEDGLYGDGVAMTDNNGAVEVVSAQ